jgi:hypothetical protein
MSGALVVLVIIAPLSLTLWVVVVSALVVLEQPTHAVAPLSTTRRRHASGSVGTSSPRLANPTVPSSVSSNAAVRSG